VPEVPREKIGFCFNPQTEGDDMDWAILIKVFLDPFLAQCLKQFSSETPQEYVRAHFNATTGTLDREIVLDAMNQTRKAIRRARLSKSPEERKTCPRYSREQVYKMTEDRLLDAMNATDEQVALAFSAAAQPGADE
jgi:hypothetical protein